MTALILALIALGTLFGLIVRAAKKAPQEYVDLMIMTEERHAKEKKQGPARSPTDLLTCRPLSAKADAH